MTNDMTELKPQYLTSASFFCSIPPIMSGIKTGGDGMRVQFDIPETEIGEAAKLLAMRGERLRVTVQVIKDNGKTDDIWADVGFG